MGIMMFLGMLFSRPKKSKTRGQHRARRGAVGQIPASEAIEIGRNTVNPDLNLETRKFASPIERDPLKTDGYKYPLAHFNI